MKIRTVARRVVTVLAAIPLIIVAVILGVLMVVLLWSLAWGIFGFAILAVTVFAIIEWIKGE